MTVIEDINNTTTPSLSSTKNRLGGGGRINYLDAIKCLGILLVIEGHVRLFGMGMETYDTLSGLMLYSFNMPLFFFVSGFLAYKAVFTVGDTLKKTWQKFLFLIIPALVFYVFRSLLEHENPLNALTLGVGGYWFTITLWECFVIYYAISLLFKDKLRDIALVVVAFAGIAFLSVFGDYGPKLLDLNRLTKYFQFFVVGVLAMKYKDQYERIIHCDWLKAASIVFFFALLFTINYGLWPSPVFHLLRDIVLRYLGTFIIVSWFVCNSERFNSNTKLNNVIMDIGKKSLPIYLLQYFFLPDFTKYIPSIAELDGFTIHLISFISALVILIVCYVFITILSNSKIIKKYVLGMK